MKRLGLSAALVYLVAVASYGFSQSMGVGVSIQEISELEISHTIVNFDLSSSSYPPPTFPYWYLPVDPDPLLEPMSISVFANTANWHVTVGFDGLFDPQTQQSIPSSQLEYSLDHGETWFEFAGAGSTTIFVGVEALTVPEIIPFDLRLRVEGSELPGTYLGELVFALSTQ